MRVALAGCVSLPEPNPDAELELGAFAAAGHEASWHGWDDPGFEPADYDAVVLRATWNYATDPEGFLAWCRRVASETALVNPEQTVAWNADKIYLKSLARKGIGVVPTLFFRRKSPTRLRQELERHGWGDIVVKPRVSAGSMMTRKFEAGRISHAEEFLAHMLESRDAMVQPFLPGVEEVGEHSVVFFEGRASHVVRKDPRFDDGDENVGEAVEPSELELGLLADVVAALPVPHAYGRLDLMPDDEGNPLVSEVELIEPSLFFKQQPEALEPFVAAVVRLAEAHSPQATTA